jgi:hypothetical protein
MRFQLLTAYIGLTFLIACGDDLASNRRRPPMDSMTPTQTVETTGLSSGLHRDRGVGPLSYQEEIKKTLNQAMTDKYHLVPNREVDDEGKDGISVTTVTRHGRPQTPCGIKKDMGINARIRECQKLNRENALWSGQENASQGEGNWTLVSVSEEKKEIWLDERTGMVWSDIVSHKANWCQASGNEQKSSGQMTLDCDILKAGVDLCQGVFTPGIEQEITWRLPTRSDYLLADVNGLRFVLKPGPSSGFWMATLDSASAGRDHAWAYFAQQGTLASRLLSDELQVRCIGVPKR